MTNIARYALDSCLTIEENTQFLLEKAQEYNISTYGVVKLADGNSLIRVSAQYIQERNDSHYNIVIEKLKY